jgi:fructokinase
MRIGIDLGGTKIEGIVLDESGKTLARRRLPSPQGNYRATLDAIADLVLGLERQTGGRGSVGIGIPGALSPATGRIKNANSTWIIGAALDRDLEQRLGRPIRLENDANCFALSEAVDGAGAGARSLFGVILGTGVGGGLVVDGRLIGGRNAVTGEWGHNPLPWPDEAERQGPRCYCGKQGCIEVFLSGPGLARDHAAATGQAAGQATGQASGQAWPAEHIVARAARGDKACGASLARFENRLSRALASVINLLDPEVIVLGGGLSGIERLYEAVPRLLPAYVFGGEVETAILPPRHGDSSGVRGAAWLWRADELETAVRRPEP